MTVSSLEIFDNNFVKLPDSKQIGQIPLLKCLSSSEGAQRWMEAPSFTRGSPTLRLGWIVVRQVLPQLSQAITFIQPSIHSIQLFGRVNYLCFLASSTHHEACNQMNSKPISEQFDASNVIQGVFFDSPRPEKF